MHQTLLEYLDLKVSNCLLYTCMLNNNNYSFFLAVGEPPLCMSSAVLYAVKRAIESARQDAGNDQPFTLCKSTIKLFLLLSDNLARLCMKLFLFQLLQPLLR